MTTWLDGSDARAVSRLTELADYVVPFTLRAICELKVADHLTDEPRSIEDLADLTGAHAPTLERAMRALACRGVFTEVSPHVYGLTPLAQALRSDHPQSVQAAYPLLAPEVVGWSQLLHTLRTGKAAFYQAHGTDFWQYMAQHPDDSRRFDASQQAVTRRELRAVLPAYDWAAFNTIVDIGGGNGTFLAGILAQFPSARGVLFDQPHVVAHARHLLADLGLEQRCEVIGGSFFDATPPGGDVYLLKRVLYAWNDQQAVTILQKVRESMRHDSKLLLVEPMMASGNSFSWGKLYDVLLAAMTGNGARTLESLRMLVAQADLEITRVIETTMLPILEARPATPIA